jgi:hypothetical protein
MVVFSFHDVICSFDEMRHVIGVVESAQISQSTCVAKQNALLPNFKKNEPMTIDLQNKKKKKKKKKKK